MSKWEVIYKEVVTKSVTVEADDRLSAIKRVLNNPNFDHSDAKVISKAGKKEFLTSNLLE